MTGIVFTFPAGPEPPPGPTGVASQMTGAPCASGGAAWTRPHPAARLLALAYMVERCIESGELRDYREPAERLGMSRAQMANVAGLLALAPEIQERIVMGAAAPTTSCLRRLAGVPVWSDQVALLPDGGCNS